MADVIVDLVPFVGTWDAGTFYLRGSCVLRSGVLYQASNNNSGFDPAIGTHEPWIDVSAAVMNLYGSVDPAAGDGVPAAIATTYQRVGVGLLTKTGAGATTWAAGEGGGGGVTVDNTVDAPVAVVTIVAAGATFDGDEATLPSGAGAAVLEDPGNVYPATPTAVALGHRISETLTGEVRVFEVSSAGTTEASAMADLELDLSPLGIIVESDVEWTYLGIVGQLPWDVAPQIEGLRVDVGAGGPLALHYTSTAGPGDSERLVVFFATVADVALEVFQAKTDGDADWFLDENTGAGFRFSNAVDGVPVPGAGVTQMTTEGFDVSIAGAGFHVIYDPFTVTISGLPTADPGVAGHLYTDGVPSAGVPQALMVSGGPP